MRARIGQKNKITRRWAKRGSRPFAPKDQHTASAYIFGAICPKEGKGAALVLPRCDTPAMNLHLAEIAKQVTPGAHAALLLDQAGWHLSGGLNIPNNITIVPLPAKCPELNPQENLWQSMRDNWLSNRIYKSYNDILDHCCYAWNTLIDRPWRIMSLGRREWAHSFLAGMEGGETKRCAQLTFYFDNHTLAFRVRQFPERCSRGDAIRNFASGNV